MGKFYAQATMIQTWIQLLFNSLNRPKQTHEEIQRSQKHLTKKEIKEGWKITKGDSNMLETRMHHNWRVEDRSPKDHRAGPGVANYGAVSPSTYSSEFGLPGSLSCSNQTSDSSCSPEVNIRITGTASHPPSHSSFGQPVDLRKTRETQGSQIQYGRAERNLHTRNTVLGRPISCSPAFFWLAPTVVTLAWSPLGHLHMLSVHDQ